MTKSEIFEKALNFNPLSVEEALFVYENSPLTELMFFANTLRKKIHNNNFVSYIIDRNINYTNICFSNCLFCNFCRKRNDKDAYLMSPEDFFKKIEELFRAGGRQILLQGGMNPEIGIGYYIDLFKILKEKYSDIKLHALSPPEIVFIAKKEKLSFKDVLQKLKFAGLDSLPGGGAEILIDRVRKKISPAKCSAKEWSDVMISAHELNITTSATMMFGHIETPEERMKHLCLLRNIQNIKPASAKGFISFTAWPVIADNTKLKKKFPEIQNTTCEEYLRMLAISRLVLNNISNIQASWLTVGKDIAGVCLSGGANDLSSIMIEENVLASAGSNIMISVLEIENLIKSHGFVPFRRDQEYQKVL